MALLQPEPAVVAEFEDVLLLSEGKVRLLVFYVGTLHVGVFMLALWLPMSGNGNDNGMMLHPLGGGPPSVACLPCLLMP